MLVLDEPTNDLDIETLDPLEDLLLELSGTLLPVVEAKTKLAAIEAELGSLLERWEALETIAAEAES